MRSKDFIDKYFNVNDGKGRTCASVYKGPDGTIYSYGYHYPLLFKVGNQTFRNTMGYSATTAKHISYCGGFDKIDVKLQGRDTSRDNVLKSLRAERDTLKAEMDTKKRHNTQVYRTLERQYLYVLDAIYDTRRDNESYSQGITD